jgi:hypothetical protein
MGFKHLTDEKRRSIVRLRTDGYSMKQISEILGVNEQTCYSTYRRIMKRTAQAVEPVLAFEPAVVDSTPMEPAPVEPAPVVEIDATDWHARCVELMANNAKLMDDLEILKSCIKRLL